MEGSQIRNMLYTDIATRQCFIGVYPSDGIPTYNIRYPAACVVNTHNHRGPGEHWTALYIKSPEDVEFFDSYGKHPVQLSTDINEYIQRFKSGIRNRFQIQMWGSEVCGAYCVYYLYHRCRGRSMDAVLSPFGNEGSKINDECRKNNDICVREFVERFFSKPKDNSRRRRRNGLWPYRKDRRFLTKP